MMKKLICAALSLAMLQTAAFAANFNHTVIGDGVITYQGSTNKNATVTFTVLSPDKKLDDFMVVEDGIVPVGYREVKSDDKGEYSVTFNIGEQSDTYNVYVGADGQTEVDYIALRYINETENEAARTLLLASGADIANVIKNNHKALGVRKSLSDEMSDELYTEAAAIYSASEDITNTLSGIAVACEKASAIALWNNNKLELFGNDTEVFGIPETVTKWYSESYMTDDVKEDIADDTSKTSDSFEAFDESIAEATALAVIKHADGYGDVQTCLKDNADLLGISESKATTSFCKSIVGKSYDSIKATGIDTYKAPGSPLGGGNGSYSSSPTYPNASVQSSITVPEPIVEEVSSFSDMAGYEWALDAVNTLYTKGVLNGKSEGVFAPAENVLREEFTKMIMTAVGFATIAGEVEFDDVTKDDWYYDYVTQAYLCGVIKGESETSFGSGKKITRQDMAVMCYNALVKKGIINDEDGITLDYVDSAEISDYAQTAVGVLTSINILTGNDDNSFMPHGIATRAEAAQMIYKALNYIAE